MIRWPGIRTATFARKETTSSEIFSISDEDRKTIKFYSLPAHHETIAAHLVRMSTHLHVKGDDTQAGFLISDFTKRLVADKITELQIFNACEFFIENSEDGFFPTFAKLRKRIHS